MVKELDKIKAPVAKQPPKGHVFPFVVTKIEQGELQEFVDPEIIKEKFKNAKLTDPYLMVWANNDDFGEVNELVSFPEKQTYKFKFQKMQNVYGTIEKGTMLNYTYDGKGWNLVL